MKFGSLTEGFLVGLLTGLMYTFFLLSRFGDLGANFLIEAFFVMAIGGGIAGALIGLIFKKLTLRGILLLAFIMVFILLIHNYMVSQTINVIEGFDGALLVVLTVFSFVCVRSWQKSKIQFS